MPMLLAGVPHIPRIAIFGGGLPIKAGDKVMGGIGVSGETVKQDVVYTQAGLDAVKAG